MITEYFVIFWIAFTVLGLTVFIIVLFWAVKNRQFGNQSRAAGLPLESPLIKNSEEKKDENVSP